MGTAFCPCEGLRVLRSSACCAVLLALGSPHPLGFWVCLWGVRLGRRKASEIRARAPVDSHGVASGGD